MNEMNSKLIFAMVIVPALFGVFQRSKEMGISVVAIALALAFANLDKLVRFKGAGFEAEMRVAIDKTQAAITDLRELALSLSRPIVDSVIMSGQVFRYMPLSDKIERIDKVEESLKKLGATQAQIDEVLSGFLARVNLDHVSNIFYALKNANPEKQELSNIDVLLDTDWSRKKVDDFIRANSLRKDDSVKEALLDWEYFLKNRKLRRPEIWQG